MKRVTIDAWCRHQRMCMSDRNFGCACIAVARLFSPQALLPSSGVTKDKSHSWLVTQVLSKACMISSVLLHVVPMCTDEEQLLGKLILAETSMKYARCSLMFVKAFAQLSG